MTLPPVRDVRDLLALIRYELGFEPRASLVLVPLDPRSGVSGPLVRVDLSLVDQAADGHLEQGEACPHCLWEEVVVHVASLGAEECLVLAIMDGSPADVLGQDVAEVAGRAADAVASVGMACVGVLLVDGERWADVTPLPCRVAAIAGMGRRREPSVLVGDWMSTGDIAASPIAAAMVERGQRVVADRSALLPVGVRDLSEGDACTCPQPRSAAEWLHRWWAALEDHCSDPSRPMPLPELSCLAGAMSAPRLRDAVLMSLACPDREVAWATLAGSAGGPRTRHHGGVASPSARRTRSGRGRPQGVGDTRLWDVIDTALAVPADHDRVAAGEQLLEGILGALPAHDPVEVLAVLGWSAWWSGRGARAGVLSEEVLARAPGHRLGRLTLALVDGLVPPPWVQSTEMSYSGGVISSQHVKPPMRGDRDVS